MQTKISVLQRVNLMILIVILEKSVRYSLDWKKNNCLKQGYDIVQRCAWEKDNQLSFHYIVE